MVLSELMKPLVFILLVLAFVGVAMLVWWKRILATIEVLKTMRAMFRNVIDLFDKSPQIMVIIDFDSLRLLNVNESACKLYGYSREELLQMTVKDIRLADSETALETIAKDIKRFETEWIYAFHRHKDGHKIPVKTLLYAFPLHGKRTYLAIITDMSEQHKIAQERLETERLKLEIEKNAEQRIWRKNFIYTILHEIRTPLSVISTSVSLLDTYGHRLSSERQKTQYERILRQVARIGELTEDMGLMLYTEATTLILNEATVDVGALCQQVIEEVQVFRKPLQTIQHTVNAPRLTIKGDERSLMRAIENLVRNAIKYSYEDGTVTLDLQQSGNNAVIYVRDEGIGIPEADLPLLFQEFKRASNVRHIEGTGLGLVIAKQAVEQHGGHISVTSQEGVGTTFIVRLPLSIETPTPQPLNGLTYSMPSQHSD